MGPVLPTRTTLFQEKSMCQIPELTQMQHEEDGCEKVLWPFLETNTGCRLHKFRNALTEPDREKYSCEYTFLWRKTESRSIRVSP